MDKGISSGPTTSIPIGGPISTIHMFIYLSLSASCFKISSVYVIELNLSSLFSFVAG